MASVYSITGAIIPCQLVAVEQTPVRPNQHELVLVSECYEGKVRVIPEP